MKKTLNEKFYDDEGLTERVDFNKRLQVYYTASRKICFIFEIHLFL